jgi:hypothetical protein
VSKKDATVQKRGISRVFSFGEILLFGINFCWFDYGKELSVGFENSAKE